MIGDSADDLTSERELLVSSPEPFAFEPRYVQADGFDVPALASAPEPPQAVLFSFTSARRAPLAASLRQALPGVPLLAFVPEPALEADALRAGAAFCFFRGDTVANPLLPRLVHQAARLFRSESDLENCRGNFRRMLDNALDAMTLGPDGTIRHQGSVIAHAFGYPDGTLVGHNLFAYVYPADHAAVATVLERAKRGGVADERVEFRFRTHNGAWRVLEAFVSAAAGSSVTVSSPRDAVRRMRMEEKASSPGLEDPLTALLSRQGFVTLAAQHLKVVKRITRQGLCFLFVKLERLPWINEVHGYLEGDLALVETARLLRETFREPDLVGRLGGDAFAVLAVGEAEMDAMTIVRRLKKRLKEYNARKHHPYELDLYIGIVHYDPKHARSIEKLIEQAEALVLRQKRPDAAGPAS